MELTWVMRFRVAAAMAAGIVLLGIVAKPLVESADPLGAITIFGGDISLVDICSCAVLAFAAGFVGFFASHPFGHYLGPLAAPAGLCYWVVRSGNMFSLLIVNNTLTGRAKLYSVLRFEGLLWLGLVAMGCLGVRVAAVVSKQKPILVPGQNSAKQGKRSILTIITALAASVVIAQFAIGLLAQDVRLYDRELGSVVGQPGVGQIAFAVFVSFGLAGFVVKKFLDMPYTVPVIASVILAYVAIEFYAAKADVLGHMIANFPPAFYPRAICAILPLQMVSFGMIGSVAGYWIAVKTEYHQRHGQAESQ